MMEKLKDLRAYMAEQDKSDSGDPLVTSLIIIGVMVVVALAIYLAFGNAMAERAEDVEQDIQNSGTQFEDRGNIEFGNSANR